MQAVAARVRQELAAVPRALNCAGLSRWHTGKPVVQCDGVLYC